MVTTKCLLTTCDKPGRDRGLCHNHANSLRYHVNAGHMTWLDLEMHGLAKPIGHSTGKRGRPRSKTMVDAIEQAKREAK